MSLFVEIEPLDKRALSGLGMDMIKFIARQQEAMVKVRKEHVKEKFGRNTTSKRLQVQKIINADFVTEDYTSTNHIGLKLTDKGWDLVGGRPFWMEA